MDLITLVPTTFVVDRLVEGWESLIWSERYSTASEFQLTSYDINGTREQLPINSFVSLLDSKEVMLVETHEITLDESGNPKLVVTGRGAETFLENRDSLSEEAYFGTPSISVAEWASHAYDRSNPDVAAVLIYYSVVSTASHNRPAEILPNTRVTQTLATSYSGDLSTVLTRGKSVYETVLEFLAVNNVGLRALRPPNVKNVISFNASTQKITTSTTLNNHLLFDIYDGSFRLDVVFSEVQGHILDSSYIWSNKGLKNIAFVRTPNMGLSVNKDTGTEATGWERRQASLSFGEANDTFAKTIRTAQREMAQTRQTQVFDGQISTDTPFKYGDDYFLGDIVRMGGLYSPLEFVRVTEYIRTEDHEGERGYPTLQALS